MAECTADELLLARVEANGYRREAHREANQLYGRGKHVTKTKSPSWRDAVVPYSIDNFSQACQYSCTVMRQDLCCRGNQQRKVANKLGLVDTPDFATGRFEDVTSEQRLS